MKRGYQVLLAISVIAVAAAFMFVAVRPRDSLVYDFSAAMVIVPQTGIIFPFKWVLIPGLLIGGWSAFQLMAPDRAHQENPVHAEREKVERKSGPTPSKGAFMTTLYVGGAITAVVVAFCAHSHPGNLVSPATAAFVGIVATSTLAFWEKIVEVLGPAWGGLPAWLRGRLGISCYVIVVPSVWVMIGDGHIDWPWPFVGLGISWLALELVLAAMAWADRSR